MTQVPGFKRNDHHIIIYSILCFLSVTSPAALLENLFLVPLKHPIASPPGDQTDIPENYEIWTTGAQFQCGTWQPSQVNAMQTQCVEAVKIKNDAFSYIVKASRKSSDCRYIQRVSFENPSTPQYPFRFIDYNPGKQTERTFLYMSQVDERFHWISKRGIEEIARINPCIDNNKESDVWNNSLTATPVSILLMDTQSQTIVTFSVNFHILACHSFHIPDPHLFKLFKTHLHIPRIKTQLKGVSVVEGELEGASVYISRTAISQGKINMVINFDQESKYQLITHIEERDSFHTLKTESELQNINSDDAKLFTLYYSNHSGSKKPCIIKDQTISDTADSMWDMWLQAFKACQIEVNCSFLPPESPVLTNSTTKKNSITTTSSTYCEPRTFTSHYSEKATAIAYRLSSLLEQTAFTDVEHKAALESYTSLLECMSCNFDTEKFKDLVCNSCGVIYPSENNIFIDTASEEPLLNDNTLFEPAPPRTRKQNDYDTVALDENEDATPHKSISIRTKISSKSLQKSLTDDNSPTPFTTTTSVNINSKTDRRSLPLSLNWTSTTPAGCWTGIAESCPTNRRNRSRYSSSYISPSSPVMPPLPETVTSGHQMTTATGTVSSGNYPVRNFSDLDTEILVQLRSEVLIRFNTTKLLELFPTGTKYSSIDTQRTIYQSTGLYLVKKEPKTTVNTIKRRSSKKGKSTPEAKPEYEVIQAKIL